MFTELSPIKEIKLLKNKHNKLCKLFKRLHNKGFMPTQSRNYYRSVL